MKTTLRYLSLNAQATWHRQVEARGHTLEAALLKATRDLESQVQAHTLRRRERGRSQLQLSAISGRWNHAQAGRRASAQHVR